MFVLLARMHLAELRVQMSVNNVIGQYDEYECDFGIRRSAPQIEADCHLGVRIASSMWVGPMTKKVASS